MRRRRVTEAEQRVARRWQLADEAPRLRTQVPELRSIRMVIEESTNGSSIPGSGHVRLFVVDTAPALFLVPCGDPRCEEGGHDLTHEMMGSLRQRLTSFEGQDPCGGNVGLGPCSRVLHYTVTATFE